MNEICSFHDDLLDRQDFAERLRVFLQVERQFVPGSLVIGLNGSFGSGKTTFLKMLRGSMESEIDPSAYKPKIVTLNAWETDYCGDPLFSIVSETLEQIPENELANQLKHAAIELGWTLLSISDQIVSKVSGVSLVEAAKVGNEKRNASEDESTWKPNAFEEMQRRTRALDHLKQVLANLASEDDGFLFLVDELDRCRPDHAINYLETIKHFFDLEGMVFIIAADRQQLENSAKSAFGGDLNTDEYFRKFISRSVELPAIEEAGYEKLSQACQEAYLEKEAVRGSLLIGKNGSQLKIRELVRGFSLTPRQVHEVFRIVGHVSAQPHEGDRTLRAGEAFVLQLATTMMIADRETYLQLKARRLSQNNCFHYLKLRLGLNKATWWTKILLTGGAFGELDNSALESEWQRLTDDTSSDRPKRRGESLSSFQHQMWNFSEGDNVKAVTRRIDEVEQFAT